MIKKVISILAVSCLLATSIVSVNADDVAHDEAELLISDPAISLHNSADPSWEWASNAGGGGRDRAWSICVDSEGNSYVTGRFEETATFGNTVFHCSGIWDIFVAKMDKYGNWLWAKQAGGPDRDVGVGICVDSNGYCYVTGQFSETASFGDIILEGDKWCTNIFVAKLNAFGDWKWVKNAPGEGNVYFETANDICIDSNEDLYVTGQFWGRISFDQIVLINEDWNNGVSIYDAFVAKIDADGNWQWASSAGGSNDVFSYAICVDSNGNSYITGDYIGTANIGGFILPGISTYGNLLVAKLDADGNWQWAKHAGAAGPLYTGGGDISVDADGNCYLTGAFQGKVSFGNIVLEGNLIFYDFFVAKLDADGNWQWAKEAGGLSLSGRIGYGIFTESAGNSYVVGVFTGTIKFGSSVLECKGEMDLFVSSLDSNGNWNWGKKAGGANAQTFGGGGIFMDSNDNIYVAGCFVGNTYFDNIKLESFGKDDIFVAKLVTNNERPYPPLINGPTSGIPGIEYTYTFVATDSDGDNIAEYIIDWGDGNQETIPGGPSGVSVTKNHTWNEKGTYTIRAKAKDENNLESNWGTLSVTMPKSYIDNQISSSSSSSASSTSESQQGVSGSQEYLEEFLKIQEDQVIRKVNKKNLLT